MSKIIVRTTALIVAVGLIAVGCSKKDKGSGPQPPKPYNSIKLVFYSASHLDHNQIFVLWAKPKSGTAAGSAVSWTHLQAFNLQRDTLTDTLVMVSSTGTMIPHNILSNLAYDMTDYDSIMVTVEPFQSAAKEPSGRIYLQGAVPDLGRGYRIGVLQFPISFAGLNATRSYFTYATPTDADTTNELSGAWFMTADRHQGLIGLDSLPGGWIYEGWAIIRRGGVRYALSMGRFRDPGHADLDNSHCGPLQPPDFPGEDFLLNSPSPSLPFPITFGPGDTLAVSVQPKPELDPSQPFPLMILTGPSSGQIPDILRNFALDSHPEVEPAAQTTFGQSQ